jgi:transposase
MGEDQDISEVAQPEIHQHNDGEGKMTCNNTDSSHLIPDALWEQIMPLLPPELPRPRGGRPRMDDRKAMEAILYVLRTGFEWKQLPRSMGAVTTVRKRFLEWREAGVFHRLWRVGLLTYDELRASFWYGRKRKDC